MTTKEDILEQLVEEYLSHKGYFTRHNIKFLPRKDHPDFIKSQDSNHSDIDVLGYNPLLTGTDRIWVVSCKSWQSGFNPESELKKIRENKVVRGREAWKSYRELTKPKWSEAFITAIESCCGIREFTYILAVAKLRGNRRVWETEPGFVQALEGNPIRIVTFKEMIDEISIQLGTTLASTEVGRILQMFKAADIDVLNPKRSNKKS